MVTHRRKKGEQYARRRVPPQAGVRRLTRRVEEFRHGPSIHSDSMSLSFPSGRPGLVRRDLSTATAAQAAAWPAIASGRHALIAAPTGSGKTLAAFLSAIDALVHEGVEGAARRMRRVSCTCRRSRRCRTTSSAISSSRWPGSARNSTRLGMPAFEIRAQVRTGDTPQTERARDAPARAAHPRDHAGVAVPAAHQRVRPPDAVDRAHGDRRRDPRGRGRPSAARTWRCRWSGSTRCAARPHAAHRAVGHAEADRGDRALPDRRPAAAPPARSSTAVMCASATSRWSCRARRSKR